MAIWVGIDVSKDTLDFGFIADGRKFHRKVPNTRIGFAEILKEVPQDVHFVMEATGTYYLNLALYLHEKGCYVAVVNPFRIKSQGRLLQHRAVRQGEGAYSLGASEAGNLPNSAVSKLVRHDHAPDHSVHQPDPRSQEDRDLKSQGHP
jgi:hypothetical protein